ncbi:hypothetical protein LTR36_010263 [Oleoguttula mirabilis]|uniref:BTB domain-containing protein n=1 Tax=Oleoguttula mirabilis TaxID=1507867 RepID=A0AAV9J4U8_9PEZI|nr:hypothetical protein LTR36_010263 [Oleoguttula mirabilis]
MSNSQRLSNVTPRLNPPQAAGGTRGDISLQLSRLYVAADILLDRALQNNIIDEFTILAGGGEFMLGRQCIPYVWKETAQDCGLRRFYLDLVACSETEESLTRFKNHGFLAEDFSPSYVELITVLAGASEEPFNVHKDVLCKKSDFFVAACSRQWMDGQQKTVRVPAIEPHIFAVYVHWLYSDKVDIEGSTENIGAPWKDNRHHSVKDLYRLAMLYVAADVVLDAALKDAIIDNLTVKVERNKTLALDGECVVYACQHTVRGCALQRCFVDRVLSCEPFMRQGFLENYEQMLPKEFFCDLAARVFGLAKECAYSDFRPKVSRRDLYRDSPDAAEGGTPRRIRPSANGVTSVTPICFST